MLILGLVLLDHQRVQVLQLLRFSYSRGIPPIFSLFVRAVGDEFVKTNPSTAQFAQHESAGRFTTMLEYDITFVKLNQAKKYYF